MTVNSFYENQTAKDQMNSFGLFDFFKTKGIININGKSVSFDPFYLSKKDKEGKTCGYGVCTISFSKLFLNHPAAKDLVIDSVVNHLINYAAGSGRPDFYNNEQSELFAEFDYEWQALPCDPEGANPEQKKEQDDLLDEYAKKIIDLM